jgi:transposase
MLSRAASAVEGLGALHIVLGATVDDDRTILGKISKRGNKYLRTLFVQAAHVVLVRRPSAAMPGLWPWIERASKRLHRNMLAIALANKLARIAWAVLARGRGYQPRIATNVA